MSIAPRLVLDSWPVLEWTYGKEPAASRFEALLQKLLAQEVSLSISRINLGELVYCLGRELSPHAASRAMADIETFPIDIVSVRDANVDSAAALKVTHRISYADAFAVDLAMRLSAPLVTGDREMRALEQAGLIQLEWLGA